MKPELGAIIPPLLNAAGVTFLITAVSIVLAGVLSFAAGLVTVSRHRTLRWLATGYVEFFRGTSLIVQLFFAFFVIPVTGIVINPYVLGPVVIALHFAAYGAVTVRAGIRDVAKGQREAAYSLGLSRSQQMRRVVLPQAIPLMLPPFGNLMLEILKATPLLYLIAVQELAATAQILRQEYDASPLIYTVCLILYFLIAQPFTFVTRRLERRLRNGDRAVARRLKAAAYR